jgi:tetratricopeptide (TPR) repeat protein
MCRTVPLWLTLAGFLMLAGCKGLPPAAGLSGDIKPALLVGPDAASEALPPVELPAKDTARLCFRTAQEFEKNGKTEDAIQLYERARGNDPSLATQAGRRLAVLYDKAGEFSKSTAEYEALLAASPKDADLLNDMGYSYYCRGQWANAESVLAKAVEFDPNHKKAWINLGLARGQLNKWDESFQAFSQAVRPAEAHCNMAFVLASQGKSDEAKSHYRQALALDPSQKLAQYALTRLENPHASDRAVTTRESGKFDPVEAAAKVPSIIELEARMKKELLTIPVQAVLPSDSQ